MGNSLPFSYSLRQERKVHMDSGVLIIGGAIVISIISFLAYAVLAFFYPEWVGITGKVALAAEEAHTEGNEATPQVFDKFTQS